MSILGFGIFLIFIIGVITLTKVTRDKNIEECTYNFNPTYTYNQHVCIKTGFYRGHCGYIEAFYTTHDKLFYTVKEMGTAMKVDLQEYQLQPYGDHE